MKIVINAVVNSPLNAVWNAWVSPEHITQWNYANEEWICPKASIELKLQEGFNYRMEAKDGSMGFDFRGIFTNIIIHQEIEYTLEDGRKVTTTFVDTDQGVQVEQRFDAENEHSAKQQEQGWQAILNNFKHHVEEN